jgi:Aspartyl protease/Retroviral aspartyl protease
MRVSRLKRLSPFSTIVVLAAGCALYSDVSISPLIVLPSGIERGADIVQMVQRYDYLRAVAFAPQVDAKQRKSSAELAALGTAELASARYDSARRHLRAALDLEPGRTAYANIAWNLSQLEYLTNNFESSREWADTATEHGLAVRPWFLELLTALSRIEAYKFSGAATDRLPLRFGRPDVPTIEARVNGSPRVKAVIDSGAVMTIISEELASTLKVQPIDDSRGIFFGLLGEPIKVRFGILDSVALGEVVVSNVPVAIMPDDKMSFVVGDRRPFKIDLLLGATLLKEFRLEIDYGRHVVTFTHLMPADRNPGPDQNLFLFGFRPFVRGTVNKHGWFLFVLDTGSEITYLSGSKVASLPIQFSAPKMHGALLQGLGGSKKHGEKIEGVEIGVDRWAGQFKTIPTYMTEEDHSVGIIGQNLLSKFRVVIDFGRMRVDLLREHVLPL